MPYYSPPWEQDDDVKFDRTSGDLNVDNSNDTSDITVEDDREDLPSGYRDDESIIVRPKDCNLTVEQRMRREEFVRQYVVDFNGRRAAMRMGYPEQYASQRASKLLNDNYTLYILDEYVRKFEEKTKGLRDRVMFRLWEEANYMGMDGGAAARISALKQLSRVLGMERLQADVQINHSGCVMVIPAVSSLDDWEKQAMRSQEVLKAEVVE